MSDLYGMLGVPRSAPDAVIKSAYRKKTKAAHPDAKGGSASKFNALKEARDVLLNPDRRAFYDSTGKVKPEEIDQGRGAVLQLLGSILVQTVAEAVNKRIDLTTEPLAGAIVSVIENQIGQIAKNKADVEKRGKIFRDIADRFEVDAGGDNVLKAICEAQLGMIQVELAMAEKNLVVHEEALKIAKSHRFRKDMKKMDGYTIVSTFATTGGW